MSQSAKGLTSETWVKQLLLDANEAVFHPADRLFSDWMFYDLLFT